MLKKIEIEFLPRGKKPGSLLMLRATDEIELIKKCRQSNIPILGIEGFILHAGGGTQPTGDDLGLTRASQNAADDNNCWDLAERFLAKYLSTDLYFHANLPLDC